MNFFINQFWFSNYEDDFEDENMYNSANNANGNFNNLGTNGTNQANSAVGQQQQQQGSWNNNLANSLAGNNSTNYTQS